MLDDDGDGDISGNASLKAAATTTGRSNGEERQEQQQGWAKTEQMVVLLWFLLTKMKNEAAQRWPKQSKGNMVQQSSRERFTQQQQHLVEQNRGAATMTDWREKE